MFKRTVILTSFLVFLSCSGYALNAYPPNSVTTKKSDSLYRIAMRARPNASVSVQQMMIALLRTNPKAFKNSNINGLKKGYHLTMPSLAAIRKTPPIVAAKLVQQQNDQWQQQSTGIINKRPIRLALLSGIKREKGSAPNKDPAKPTEALKNMITLRQLSMTNQQLSTRLDQMENRVASVVEVTDQYQSSSNEQYSKLEQQNQVLRKEVVQLKQQLQSTKKQVQEINTQQQKLLEQNQKTLRSRWQALTQKVREYTGDTVYRILVWLIIFIILLFILRIIIKLGKHKKTSAKLQNKLAAEKLKRKATGSGELEEEYDFLNSEEGIPAKLDLARAYMDMEDEEAARKVLNEVLESGDAEQKKRAQKLLDKLAKTKK